MSHCDRRASAFISLLIVGVFLGSFGCISPRAKVSRIPVEPQVIKTSVRFQKQYVLVPGDQIEVVVRGVPEVSRLVSIRADGNISLPLVQDVVAAGSTPQELATKLTDVFSARLVKPEVTVIPTQVRQAMVYVAGDLSTVSGVALPLHDAPTALQAVTLAGGLRKTAAARDITIIRLNEEGYIEAIPVTTKGGGQPAPYLALRTMILQADDIVFVPENGRSQVSRFIDEVINKPILGLNSVVGTYVNFRLIERL